MLGRGDFVELLMEQLGSSLSRPANTLYRHNLTATLETAVRGSTSANDSPEILKRLDARMMEYSHGEIGWDSFTLEYKVEQPLDTVLDPQAMTQYGRMFNQLWRIKRVEVAVGAAWRRIMTSSRMFNRVPGTSANTVLAVLTNYNRSASGFAQSAFVAVRNDSLRSATAVLLPP